MPYISYLRTSTPGTSKGSEYKVEQGLPPLGNVEWSLLKIRIKFSHTQQRWLAKQVDASRYPARMLGSTETPVIHIWYYFLPNLIEMSTSEHGQYDSYRVIVRMSFVLQHKTMSN